MGLEASACKPSGLGMGATATGEYEHAGVGPEHGVQIGLEAFLGNRVGEVPDVFFRLPFLPVFIHVRPTETSGVVLGIAEIIDFVAFLPEGVHDFGLVLVPPTGGDINLCHGFTL